MGWRRLSVRGSLRASPPTIYHLSGNQSYPPMPCKLKAVPTRVSIEAAGAAHPAPLPITTPGSTLMAIQDARVAQSSTATRLKAPWRSHEKWLKGRCQSHRMPL